MKRTFMLLCSAALFGVPCWSQALDPYGGLKSLKCQTATGYFHVEKLGSRWWFCTPAGNAFFMEGVYAVASGVDASYLNAVKRKYRDTSTWAEETNQRLKSWGFNTLGLYAQVSNRPSFVDPSYPTDSSGSRSQPVKLPFLINVRPALYSMTNPLIEMIRPDGQKLLEEPVKNIIYGESPYYKEYRPSTGIADYFDRKMGLWLERDLAQAKPLNGIKNSPSLSYLVGIGVDDGDQMYGFGAGDAFPTIPAGHNNAHLSWLVAIAAPRQTFNAQYRVLYRDTADYTKEAWRDMLAARYGTINALNASWQSEYTTFDSSSAFVNAEMIAAGDGTTTSFVYTLAHTPVTPLSITVSLSGAPQGGDCPYWIVICGVSSGGSLSGPSGTTIQASSQPWLRDPEVVNCNCSLAAASYWVRIVYHFSSPSRMVGVPSRRLGVTVAAGKQIQIESPRPDESGKATGYDVYVATAPPGDSPNGLETLQAANIPFGTNWLEPRSGLVDGASIPPSLNTIDYNTGRIQLNFTSPPPRGASITVSYAYNGWMSGGTGLMDEDGRPAHQRWLGNDSIYLSNTNPNVKADLDTFLLAVASQYLGTCQREIKKAFPHILFIGPDSIGSWGAPARVPVLQAASKYVDVLSGPGHYDARQDVIDYTAQYFGDKPVLEGQYRTANLNSPWFSYPGGQGSDFPTQEARGQDYYNAVTGLQSKTVTATGSHPFVGEAWWQYTDNRGEQKNWGLVTLFDNAYDGQEDVSGTVKCSAPLQSYSCGGEAANYGDVITSVRSANLFWLTH
jgi:hypothetical protein